MGKKHMLTKKFMDCIGQVRGKFLPRILKSQIEKIVYSFTDPRIKKHVLLHGELGSAPVFCIVHWNAPDFLLLTVNQIECLYPNSKIYVLDNGSQQVNIDAVKKGLDCFDNITLFVASLGIPKWATWIGRRLELGIYSHTNGLQFLLNYAAEKQDEIAVFVDQDCILSNNIDDLFPKLGQTVVLIGAKDDRGCNLVHASFMILQPKRVKRLFGKFSIFLEHTNAPEPYHGLSFKTEGKTLFLDSKPHDTIPLLTSYSLRKTTYAWHAWYSSRTVGLSTNMSLDGMSISYLQTIRKIAFEYMKQIHEDTIKRCLTTNTTDYLFGDLKNEL